MPCAQKEDAMSEEAIRIATEYLQQISAAYEANVLGILYAYAVRSK